jgi:protein-serine/threonine kinase
VDQSFSSSAQTPPSSATRRTYGSPSAPGASDDNPFAPPPGSASVNVVSPSAGPPAAKQALTVEPAQSSKGHKTTGSASSGGFRHTIQVEYGEPAQNSRKSEDKEKRARDRSGSQGQTPKTATTSPAAKTNGAAEMKEKTKERRPSQGSINMKPLPPSPPSAPATSTTPSSYRSPTQTTSPPSTSVDNYTTPTKPKNSTPRSASASRPGPISPPGPETPTVNINPASPPDTPITFVSTPNADERDTGSQGSSKKGHTRGRSSIDKLGFGKIFGGGHVAAGEVSPGQMNGRVPSEGGNSGTSAQSSNNGSSVLLSPVGSDREKEKDGKKSRRNTLTVMVEPFSRSIRNRGAKGRMASTPGGSVEPVSAAGIFKGQPQSAVASSGASAASGKSGVKSAVGPIPSFAGAAGEMGEAVGGAGMQASTSKARKVMAWFRTKSKVRESSGAEEEDEKEKERSGTPTQAEYKKSNAASSSAVNNPTVITSPPVQVVVTTPTSAHPRSPPSAAPTESRRMASTGTESSFTTSSLVSRFRNSVTVGGGGGSAREGSHRSASATQHPWGALRIHHGAVDQTTITTKAPPEVIKHVREVLEGMGVEIQVESEYKYRCIRAKRRKGSMVIGAGPGTSGLGSVGPNGGANSGSTTGLAAFTMVGSAASNGVSHFVWFVSWVGLILV